MIHRFLFIAIASTLCLSLQLSAAEPAAVNNTTDKPWPAHTIDNTANGADGVRLADANGDGLLDIATGWEEAGLVRVYLNPGPEKSKQPWPSVTVGKIKSPEDAVLIDLDQDGAVDVVSCCEGKVRSVFVHWAPQEQDRYLDATAWKTEAFPALENHMAAMYCLPLEIDGQPGIDLVIGGKNAGSEIGWLSASGNRRDLAKWKWHPMTNVGWVMSLVGTDVDGDGHLDILASDRKGREPGCIWLKNPGPGEQQSRPWKKTHLSSDPHEVMFLHHVDMDGDKLLDVVVPTVDKHLLYHHRTAAASPTWETIEFPWPASIGRGKGVRIADIDLDGRIDLVLSSENFEGTSGAVWMATDPRSGETWIPHNIVGPAGPKGLKMDDVQLLDVDQDGDLDVLSTEERTGLGVVWFENPTK